MTCTRHGYSYDCARCVKEKYIKQLAEQAADHSIKTVALTAKLERAERQRDEALNALEIIKRRDYAPLDVARAESVATIAINHIRDLSDDREG